MFLGSSLLPAGSPILGQRTAEAFLYVGLLMNFAFLFPQRGQEVACCQPAPPAAAAGSAAAHRPARLQQPHDVQQPGRLPGAEPAEPTAGGAAGAPGAAGREQQGEDTFSSRLQPCCPKATGLPRGACAWRPRACGQGRCGSRLRELPPGQRLPSAQRQGSAATARAARHALRPLG